MNIPKIEKLRTELEKGKKAVEFFFKLSIVFGLMTFLIIEPYIAKTGIDSTVEMILKSPLYVSFWMAIVSAMYVYIIFIDIRKELYKISST